MAPRRRGGEPRPQRPPGGTSLSSPPGVAGRAGGRPPVGRRPADAPTRLAPTHPQGRPRAPGTTPPKRGRPRGPSQPYLPPTHRLPAGQRPQEPHPRPRRSSPCGTAGCRGRRARTARSACGPSAAAAAAPRRSRTPPWRPQATGQPRRPIHRPPPPACPACPPAWPPCPPAAAGSRRAARSHGPQSSLAAGPGAEAASPPPPPGVCGHRGGRLTPASCAPRPRRPAPPPPPKTANRGRGARPAVGPRPNRRSAPARLQLWNVGGGYPVASRREGSGETSPSPPCPARPIERRGRRERRASQPTRQRQDCSRRAPPRPRGVERVRAGGGCVRRGVLRAAAAGRGSAGGAAAPAGPDSCPPRSRRAPRGLPGAVRALPLLQRFVWVRRRRTASRHGHASGLRPPEGLPARGSERRRRWKAGEAGLPPVTGGECRAKRPGQPLTPTRRCRCGAQVNFSGVTVAVTGQLGFWFS